MKVAVVLVALLLGLVGTGMYLVFSSRIPTTREPAHTQRHQAQEVPEVRYGPTGDVHLLAVIAERTGPTGPQNQPVFAAVRYVIDRANAAGGVLGKPIGLIEYDNRSQPLVARAAAQRAVASGALAVIGACRSEDSLAMASVLEAAGVPMITPESTNERVTTIGDYIFRACFTDPFQAQVLATFVHERLHLARAVTLTCSNRIFSIDLSRRFGTSFANLGGTVLWDERYIESDTDFSAIVSRLLETRPEVVFIPGEVRDSGLIIRQATAAGLVTTWVGPDSWNRELVTISEGAAVGAYFSTHWHRDSDLPASRAFVADYERTTGPISRAGVALYCDATALLLDSLQRAGRAERRALRDALAATAGFPGITGNLSFSAGGDPIGKPAVILRLTAEGEQFIVLQTP